VKIGSVLSDVFGMTGQTILEALLEGKATPEEMAKLARGVAKRKIPQLVEALKGHRLTDAQRFLIEHCLQHMAFLEQSLEQLEARILQQIEEAGLTRPFELLQTVPAIKQAAAAAVLAEIGSSMEPFPTPGQLASWAGVCPGNNRSADKSRGTHCTKGNQWLRSVLAQCAWAASLQLMVPSSRRVFSGWRHALVGEGRSWQWLTPSSLLCTRCFRADRPIPKILREPLPTRNIAWCGTTSDACKNSE
jgi:transposase